MTYLGKISDSVLFLDPSIGTSNVGDEIIMECVRKELEFVTRSRFVYCLPTHVSAFHWYQVWRNSLALQKYSHCKYKFVCGSNLLVKDMMTHYPQWNINLFNYKPFAGSILVGVGAGAGEKTNLYTRTLYKKLLSHHYIHSVRDERTKEFVESLGLRAYNTGCISMWRMTPEFCKTIPSKKSERVIFTLTAGSGASKNDNEIIDILRRNYRELYFWVQGDDDWKYFSQFPNTDGIKIIPPKKDAYDALLKEADIDYVGTRLHAGIYAMRHSKRSIIIAIDERAREIKKCNNLVCIDRMEIPEKLEGMITSEFETQIKMPMEVIERWKAQFQ